MGVWFVVLRFIGTFQLKVIPVHYILASNIYRVYIDRAYERISEKFRFFDACNN